MLDAPVDVSCQRWCRMIPDICAGRGCTPVVGGAAVPAAGGSCGCGRRSASAWKPPPAGTLLLELLEFERKSMARENYVRVGVKRAV